MVLVTILNKFQHFLNRKLMANFTIRIFIFRGLICYCSWTKKLFIIFDIFLKNSKNILKFKLNIYYKFIISIK